MDQAKEIIEEFKSGKISLEKSVKALTEHIYN